ncbi:MAG: NAD(P)(+) transhydrogenase (Re/Si-specific) subunit alpha [Oscillospiraceae bacterium]|nr:NAD(P)(+) transhydrogenase (Re/Si-specific) subunit alpha [Oscillospiraceae bacterium]
MNTVLLCAETTQGETRVALVPKHVKALCEMGYEIFVQSDAGMYVGFTDDDYIAAGAKIVTSLQNGYDNCDIVVRVNKLEDNISGMRERSVHICSFDTFKSGEEVQEFADAGIRLISLDMVPHSSITAKMDVQSSQSSLAGYYAVVLAASKLPKIFPMLYTPAGNIPAARIFVIGANTAGLQAIATARRMGARVVAYDTSPALAEKIESLGAKFIEINLGEASVFEDDGTATLTPKQLLLQRQGLLNICAHSDIVITSDYELGKSSPLLVTKDMISYMKPGSLIVDMAVNNGGNVEGSSPNNDVVYDGVMIISGNKLERYVPIDASNMFSGNVFAFLEHFWDSEFGTFKLDTNDEIMSKCLVHCLADN